MTERKPAMVWPLASHLAEEMEARGWTYADVVARMTGDVEKNIIIVNLLLAVQKDSMILDDELLTNLAVAFDVSPAYFRNLHQGWLDNPEARQPFDCPEHLLGGIVFPANENAKSPPA